MCAVQPTDSTSASANVKAESQRKKKDKPEASDANTPTVSTGTGTGAVVRENSVDTGAKTRRAALIAMQEEGDTGLSNPLLKRNRRTLIGAK